MAPLTPHWSQPSHPLIQKVVLPANPEEFTTKSLSLVDLPPFAVFAKLAFPPCTPAPEATYATVQMGRDKHLNLNSDLVYINHSCEPSVLFDTTSLLILAGPRGLKRGEELTFFYPSTEWDMAQGFDCFCGTPSCKGHISGAKNMSAESLTGMFLNAHIRDLLIERDGLGKVAEGVVVGLKEENGNGTSEYTNGHSNGNSIKKAEHKTSSQMNGASHVATSRDPTIVALETSLAQARKLVDSTQKALDTYKSLHCHSDCDDGATQKGAVRENGVGSRELSGEMGGDTL